MYATPGSATTGNFMHLRTSLIINHLHPLCRANRSSSQSGDQRSQIKCEKSTHKHILNLAQKNPAQHKIEFFEMKIYSFRAECIMKAKLFFR
jgi:hypothetical protein